ncbi:cilia- and flagella-associated protein 410 isoform X2 [Ostrinia furnacalis]|uniref:cilia- and flagella-associated protein 410 isoform X2 n=1 Tax=Ostrinia furnacalis TaxID=93504 RepID=UPI00103F2A41|nr:cilia- and flagella-associated protein 410 isoform X2 [Ostrinia furnacalis]
MARLTEEMVIARSKQSDLSAIKKLNCWGAELGDVSLLRRMPNVEVLALSINKIRTLGDFAGCRRLRELYVRKNEIRDLGEIRHLRRLPALTSLWLDENPCTTHPEYRMTVLRNLPNLEKLDNVPVHPEEVQEAMRRGVHIPDSDDEGYPQQETYGQYRRQRSCDSSPERDECRAPPRHDQGSDSSEAGAEPAPAPEPARPEPQQCPLSPTRRVSPEPDERYEYPAMTRSQYEARAPRSPDAPLRHSLSAHSVKDYAYSTNGECRYSAAPTLASPPHYSDGCYERSDRAESYQQVPTRPGPGSEWDRDRDSARERDRDYPSAVMAEHRGFTRRPVARNSNLLSAVLCLVKELDYPSLEVAEMAVRCRMDELANSQ